MLEFCLTALHCCVFYCRPVSAGVSPGFFLTLFFFSFPLPFALQKRPPIRLGGGRRLCGIIMGSSWENCPWKGLSDKKKKRKRKKQEKFGLVSDPSRKHSSGHSCCSEGSLCCCQGRLSRGQEARGTWFARAWISELAHRFENALINFLKLNLRVVSVITIIPLGRMLHGTY